ncbi:hypothetical protein IF2G_02007 [Cordyceps javanica]|nr:hypothetical protein IF2G_02007 [Cordyceps javanica]
MLGMSVPVRSTKSSCVVCRAAYLYTHNAGPLSHHAPPLPHLPITVVAFRRRATFFQAALLAHYHRHLPLAFSHRANLLRPGDLAFGTTAANQGTFNVLIRAASSNLLALLIR